MAIRSRAQYADELGHPRRRVGEGDERRRAVVQAAEVGLEGRAVGRRVEPAARTEDGLEGVDRRGRQDGGTAHPGHLT